jgi:hypothetical protein
MRGSTWLIFLLLAILAAVYLASPRPYRVSALAILSGLFGLGGSLLAIYEPDLGARHPKVAVILASAAFFTLIASVLVQELQPD